MSELRQYHIIAAAGDGGNQANGVKHNVCQSAEQLYQELVELEELGWEYVVILGEAVAVEWNRLHALVESRKTKAKCLDERAQTVRTTAGI